MHKGYLSIWAESIVCHLANSVLSWGVGDSREIIKNYLKYLQRSELVAKLCLSSLPGIANGTTKIEQQIGIYTV